MQQMLQAAYHDCVDTLVVTPHCIPGMQEIQLAKWRERIDEAQRYCVAAHVPISIVQGAEILYTPALHNVVRDRTLPTLGNTRYVLVEFVPDIGWRDLRNAVALLTENGYRPVIAHVERYRSVFGHMAKLKRLKGMGDVLIQINCASILHPQGLWQRIRIKRMLCKKLPDIVATDAHDIDQRQTRMADTYRALLQKVPTAYANALVSLTPRKIARDA